MVQGGNQVPQGNQIQVKCIKHASHGSADGGHRHSAGNTPGNQGCNENGCVLQREGQLFLFGVKPVAHLAGKDGGQALVAADRTGEDRGNQDSAKGSKAPGRP